MEQSYPEVGMGVTEVLLSDRYPYTIIAVGPHAKRILVQEDHATRTDDNGMSDQQEWRYERNSEGKTVLLSLRNNGRYHTVGQPKAEGRSWHIGSRRMYYDFSF